MHGKTISGACGYEEIDTVWGDDVGRMWQGLDANGCHVIVLERIIPGLQEKERNKVVSLLMSHAMNARSGALRITKCFWRNDMLYVIHEGAVHVKSRMVENCLPDNNFSVLMFVQAVYAVGMSIDDEWLCSRIGMKNMWIASDGSLQIGWSDIMLNCLMMPENEGKLMENNMDYDDCGCEVKERRGAFGTSGGFKYGKNEADRLVVFPMALKGMLLELMKHFLRVSDTDVDAETVHVHVDALARHELEQPMKNFLNDCKMMVDVLFVKGVRMDEVKRWVELMHEASGKSMQRMCGAFRSGYKGEITDCRGTPVAMDEAENSNGETGNSSMEEESSKNASEGECRARSFGTREYKRGRFHVCEAVPLGDKDKEVRNDEYASGMMRMLSLQSKQIGIIAKAMHRVGSLDTNEKNELACLDEEWRILMSDLER
ncbi:hypothetical protein HK407_09g15210 [Ordospora pajunii]|jgi:hypothetical protein|uniref:uncharacterized protein n=1 Tax=Ordospora pajunii TaxID=3039483 RepID=UPI002952778E|nr:uncharacterized protein HK407_09g15210 [Ordospora pajunii]KAH9410926.1 hypothetical protein HK407_09g15210 [Ordospora pajunii]